MHEYCEKSTAVPPSKHKTQPGSKPSEAQKKPEKKQVEIKRNWIATEGWYFVVFTCLGTLAYIGYKGIAEYRQVLHTESDANAGKSVRTKDVPLAIHCPIQ